MAGKKGGIEAGRAFVKAYLDDSAVTRGLKNMRSSLQSFAGSLQSVGGKLLAGGGGIMALFAAPLRRASQIELLTADLAVLLGGVDQAKKALADWRKFAAETPLEFADVSELGKQLLTWKLATQDTVVETLRMIGDASGGVAERMAGVVVALGQMRAKGKLQSQEMMQLTERGIPAWEMLAKILGTDVQGAMEAVTAGSVDAATVLPRLIQAMGEFGQGRMAQMAKTLIGRMSALKDAIWEAVTPIGEALLPVAGRLVTLAESLVGKIGEWVKANAGLAVKGAAAAAAMIVLGSAMIAASVAIRGAVMTVSGLGMGLRIVLFPATLAVTAAIRLLQGVVNIATGAMLAARGAVVAVAGTLKGLSLAAGIATNALKALGLGILILRWSTLQTRAALAIAATVAYTFRTAIWAAQAAVFVFGGTLKIVAVSLGALSVVLGLLASPAFAVAAGAAAIGAAIWYAMQQGVKFGDVVDWLREKLGPLATKVMEVFKTISDALMVGEMSAAVKVLWASIQLAFAHGAEWIRGLWIDLTDFLATQLINLASQVEVAWSIMLYAITSKLEKAAKQILKTTSGLAKKLGLSKISAILAISAERFGSTRGPGVFDAERRRQETLATQRADTARRREAIEGSTADEAKNLEDALNDARIATTLAKDALEAVPAAASEAMPDTALPSVAAKASDALNTAAIVGTQEGADAFARATSGFRQITPGEKMLGDKLDVIAEGIDGMVDKAVVIMEGTTA